MNNITITTPMQHRCNTTIPSGWKIKTLDQIGTFLKGKGITKSEIVETGKPCIRYGQIYSEYNYFVEEFKSFINDISAKNSNPIFKNDLLFAGSGETLEDIGKCVAYIKSDEAYAGGDIIILRPHSEDAHYLGYLLNSDEVKKQTFKLGQGHSVVHIYSSSLKNLKITLPLYQEQQKIAQILSTWDKAIVLQQKLIIQKQQNKKAIMKKLLTGEVRFKGFTEEWNEVRIKDTLKYERPDKYIVESDVYSDEHITPVLTANKSFILGYTNENEGIYSNFPIILFDDFTTDNKFVDFPFKIKSSAIKILNITNEKFDLKFIFERMQIFNFPKEEHKRYYISEYQYLKFKCPEFNEQKKIATYSVAIDQEINALQKQLIAMQEQKKGLMQQLLTGKLRVKI
ncbi:restriction endonuclease subunit S [Flavobacterium bomense]|uniref:Restriction endonuclease subunit S n=1 Tax=Flavobacterium bomense TaxID=2497483 RepID=A0A432CKP9_9FLAO|nr:restriction endonuclease subunit S [Flavobacterium bomense]RTZ03582.1 restriction endonuclease subunit S [Flavobacterium bomense]